MAFSTTASSQAYISLTHRLPIYIFIWMIVFIYSPTLTEFFITIKKDQDIFSFLCVEGEEKMSKYERMLLHTNESDLMRVICQLVAYLNIAFDNFHILFGEYCCNLVKVDIKSNFIQSIK